ncbi:MAG: hypothetical protein WBW73_10495 [Rhodoplanes sp.]
MGESTFRLVADETSEFQVLWQDEASSAENIARPADGNNTFVLVAVPQRTQRTPVFNASNANTGGG